MSMKRFGSLFLRCGEALMHRLWRIASPTKYLINVLPRVSQANRVTVPRSRNVFVRFIREAFRGSNRRLFIRPFSIIDHNRIRFSGYQPWIYPLNRMIRQVSSISILQRIKNLFSTNIRYNKSLLTEELPNRLDGYDIGDNIACGCNAAVYKLRLATDPFERYNTQFTDSQSYSEVFSTNSRYDIYREVPLIEDCMKAYPLALKLMFNYQFDAPERCLWQDMGNELVPIVKANYTFGYRLAHIRTMPHYHPNVIKMYTAFTDVMPILPDAHKLYPEALPIANFYDLIIKEPITLFIVMKRYRMTLREYVLTKKRNYWTGRVLFGQLLEAIVFMYDNKISHRDMKSDNVLLDFNSDEDIPNLVVSDFGCALSTGSWIVNYSHDGIDLGGNLALRAPEISRAVPGDVLDFSLADLWAAGTLGYEIFTRLNPFYSSLKSYGYVEYELPNLPRRVHYVIKSLIQQILQIDPRNRPSPHIAANVVSLSLLGFGEDLRFFLSSFGVEAMSRTFKNFTSLSDLKASSSRAIRELGAKLELSLNSIMLVYASESMFARHLEGKAVSSAELQLRATFLSRVDLDNLWSAVNYFYADSE